MTRMSIPPAALPPEYVVPSKASRLASAMVSVADPLTDKVNSSVNAAISKQTVSVIGSTGSIKNREVMAFIPMNWPRPKPMLKGPGAEAWV